MQKTQPSALGRGVFVVCTQIAHILSIARAQFLPNPSLCTYNAATRGSELN